MHLFPGHLASAIEQLALPDANLLVNKACQLVLFALFLVALTERCKISRGVGRKQYLDIAL
jgi:hypothetical protein